MIKIRTESSFADMDGFIKFLLALVIAWLPFYFQNQVSYGVFLVYLLLVTLASGIRYRTLLLSCASYCIIVLIPYLFGMVMNGFLYYLTKNEAFILQDPYEIVLRLFRLLIIWYISILYFQTTPMETILGLLDKLLFPLKMIKLPVQDFLKVIMCIVMELKGTGEEVKTRFLDNARSAVGGSNAKLKSKINGISQIIVSSLVDSFQKLDNLERFVESVDPEKIIKYRFKMTEPEWVAVFSISFLVLLIDFIEKSNGFPI